MDVNDREVPASYFFDHIAEDYGLYEFLKGESDNFYEWLLNTSVDDVASGGYSETFNEALEAYRQGGGDIPEDILSNLRGGDDSYAIYLGFIYEKYDYNINDYEIDNLFSGRVEDDDLNKVIDHLLDIGFDEFGDESEYKTILDGHLQLRAAKLETGTNYNIDKGRVLRITGVDNDNTEKPYKVFVKGEDGETLYGNIGFEALKNLLYNKSLFENKKGKR